jgi:hypothetical protein
MSDGNSVTVVCDKQNCAHKDDNCAAYLGKRSANNGYNVQNIYYHNENLYVIYNDFSGTGLSYLEKIATDGSSRSRLFEIGTAKSAYALTFHDNSVYINVREGDATGKDVITATIRKRSLDGKNDDIIFSYTAKGAIIYAAKSYGNYLYFLTESYDYDKEEAYKYYLTENNGSVEGEITDGRYERNGLFRYEYASGNTSNVLKDSITDYTFDIDNNVLYYYVFNKGLYKMPISAISGTDAAVIYTAEPAINAVAQISYANGCVYISNDKYFAYVTLQPKESSIYVINADGNVSKITNSTQDKDYQVYFTDGQKLFAGANGKLYYIDLKSGGTPEWTPAE